MSIAAKLMSSLSQGMQSALQRVSRDLHLYNFPAADRGVLMSRAGLTPGVAAATGAPQQVAQPIALAPAQPAAQPVANRSVTTPDSAASQQPAAARPVQVATKMPSSLAGKALWGS